MIGFYEGTAVIVQARLNSKRLHGKALLDLGGKSVLYRVLNSVRNLPAECFVLACPEDSKKEFQKTADSLGFICVAGPEDDVLKRFCMAIEYINKTSGKKPISSIVRVTADNPFLFIQAAESSIRRYFELGMPDYFTYTGLPHGSGIEILKPAALLRAEKSDTSAYEREHVGPAVYGHPDVFRCVREPAPLQWYFPDIRTTIDTEEDYENAKEMIKYLLSHGKNEPLPQDIIEAYEYAHKPIIFSPSIIKGQGSGHLRRVCSLVLELLNDVRCLIYIPEDELPDFSKKVLSRIPAEIIIHELPETAALIVLDRFKTSEEEMLLFKNCAPVAAIDDGGDGRRLADFILDILPSLNTIKNNMEEAGTECNANLYQPAFIPLPVNRKKTKTNRSRQVKLNPAKTKVLVVCGGENDRRMALPAAMSLSGLKFDVSAIDAKLTFEDINACGGKIKTYSQIDNLRERLHEWDLIVTHYGFTAFEALAAGCYVLLISPTAYHYRLGTAAGFTALKEGIPTTAEFAAAFLNGIKVPNLITPESKAASLPLFIKKLSFGRKHSCPICGAGKPYEIAARTPDRTVAKCLNCEIHYLSFIISPPKQYSKNYFFDEYKAQYGKTYLEDFDSIRKQGLRRMNIIDNFYEQIFYKKRTYNIFSTEKRILDIGCAYGPFLYAAKQKSWQAIGTDISEAAVQYVTENLKLPAFISAFPALPEKFEFIFKKTITGSGYEKLSVPLNDGSFAAVSMWYVIEHFQDLDSVLCRINSLLMPGGIFAFSTPNLRGVTGRFFQKKFFTQSPSDHYSIWDEKSVTMQLEKYGFKILKIVSTGHHPERFQLLTPLKKDGFVRSALTAISKLFKLGDTMEVYAMKQNTLDDIE